MADPPSSTVAVAEGKSVQSPMEDQVRKLAEKAWNKFQTFDESQRYLIAVAGIPGSGKTTFAASLAYHLNQLHQEHRHKQFPNSADHVLTRARSNTTSSNSYKHEDDPNAPDVAYVLPMDGFHLTRAQLSAMPNPDEAHYRRGAAFTFDSEAYLTLITRLKRPIEPATTTIWAPSFDHEVKDPVEKDIPIPPTARIVIVEGLYVALSYSKSKTNGSDSEASLAWADASSLMDDIWLIEVPIPVATERVAKRNFRAGLSPTYEAALKRTIENDMRNAQEILDNLPPGDRVTERIKSIDDEEWKSHEVKDDATDEETAKKLEEEEYTARRLRLERLGSIAELADAGAGM